jgi:hypothetical protein
LPMAFQILNARLTAQSGGRHGSCRTFNTPWPQIGGLTIPRDFFGRIQHKSLKSLDSVEKTGLKPCSGRVPDVSRLGCRRVPSLQQILHADKRRRERRGIATRL